MEQPSVPTLHHLASSQSMRVLWALEEIVESHRYKDGFKYNLVLYKRRYGPNPDLQAVFPIGKSPIMTVEENDGRGPKVYQLNQYPGVLAESILIMEFVNETYANRIWDAEPEDEKRAKYLDVLAHNTLSVKIISALLFDIIPAMMPFGIRHLLRLMVNPIVNYWKNDMQPSFQVMEDVLSETKPWFAGSSMGLADFNMSWCMDMATQRGYFDGKKYPKVQAWVDRVYARPAYQRALEKGGTYDLKTFGTR
ncbi:glutathione S-transferase [Rhizodiscina lignyota]|uniref:Glutathione S-transferase n=1 Tax=Rhizodiscina lignyota TaxID=1504668 RepID=A0A9P4M700_9PEZI|nr:glutathione S-transferase [Rhizodiscina lignyota]